MAHSYVFFSLFSLVFSSTRSPAGFFGIHMHRIQYHSIGSQSVSFLLLLNYTFFSFSHSYDANLFSHLITELYPKIVNREIQLRLKYWHEHWRRLLLHIIIVLDQWYDIYGGEWKLPAYSKPKQSYYFRFKNFIIFVFIRICYFMKGFSISNHNRMIFVWSITYIHAIPCTNVMFLRKV